MKQNRGTSNVITQAQLELGLLESSYLLNKYQEQGMPEAFKILVEYIDDLTYLEENMNKIEHYLTEQINSKVIIFCGFEARILDRLQVYYESIIIVPNSSLVDFERIQNNYSSHNNATVLSPITAAEKVCPNTSILVPVFPLDDGTYLTYSYASKLLTADARKNCYQILAMEICSPLPIENGYDPSGLTKLMSPTDKNYFTKFLTLKTNSYGMD